MKVNYLVPSSLLVPTPSRRPANDLVPSSPPRSGTRANEDPETTPETTNLVPPKGHLR